jgi:hypothetical protein
MLNHRKFFDEIRDSLFKRSFSQSQVDGIESLLALWEENFYDNDVRFLAYILATAYHETGARMVAVREGFCKTNKCSINHVTKLYRRGKINKNYALPNTFGNSFYGRGHVQLTHKANYIRMANFINKKYGTTYNFFQNPDLVLRNDISAIILIEGMINGLFTNHKLSDYIVEGKNADYVNARRIVNGTDNAKLIAGYAEEFEQALKNAIITNNNKPHESELPPVSEVVTGKKMMKSTTNLSTVIGYLTSVGTIITTLAEANPWVAALLIIVLTGAAGYIIYERRNKRYYEGI